MAGVDLDTALLSSAHPKKQAEYLQRLRDEGATDLVLCQALAEAVSSGRLTTRILNIFFGCRWNKTPSLAATAVKHGSGLSLRQCGIRLTGRLLAKPRSWEAMWNHLGGIEGLVALFASISVHEVKLLSRAMMLGSFGPRVPAREEAIEGLVKALLPKHYPESEFQSQDKRPLQHLYARMLPACSVEFIDALLDSQNDSNPLYKHCYYSKLISAHRELMRERVEAVVLRVGVMDEYTQRSISDCLRRDTAFAVRVVKLSLKHERKWPVAESQLEIITHHLRKTLKKSRASEDEKRSMLSLALQVAQAKQQKVHDLWPVLCALWQHNPTLYEDLFEKALRRGLASPRVEIGQNCTTSWYGKLPEMRWDWALLRLYCLHVPEKGIDIDTATDFKPLAKIAWPIKIFDTMSREQARRILAGLYAANPDYNFLDPGRWSESIFKFREIKSMSRRNFNVELLRTTWDAGSEGALQIATDAVDKLRQKASSSKEQSDRAEIARAASLCAIASGDLDLYQETITWQKRFVRDPLTVKTLYSRDIVLTPEGVELLTGIPEKLLGSLTLEDVAIRIAKANDVLITFYDTMVLAKREPSFQQQDWTFIPTLTNQVLRRRALQLKEFMKNKRPGRGVEVFSVLWESSLELVDKMHQNVQPITIFYEKGFSPAILAAITKMMLDSVAERRKEKDWQREDDALDTMSLGALRKITDSEHPEQATQLILRTVLERPDASSLHRGLLSVGLLKSLPAAQAQEVLLKFATGIGEKLEEQSYVKVGEAEPSKSAPSQPLVKVTTAKYLAQLLDNAEYISSEAAIEVLIELFKAGQHRDVRLATLDSLLGSLNDICNGPEETWHPNPFFERILKALESIVPIAASINERRVPREEEWLEAASGGSLPEISDACNELPPLLLAVLMAPRGDNYPNLNKLQAEFVSRLILPVIAQSQAAHQRWISLFLTKYEASFEVMQLPPTPISPLVWLTALPEYAHLLPAEVLDDYYRYVKTISVPTSELKEFNESLRSNSKLRNNPAVQHWLQIYGENPDAYQTSGLKWLLDILDRLYKKGVSTSRVIYMVVGLVTAMLHNYEGHINTWNGFVSQLQPPFESRRNEAADTSFAQDYQIWKDTRQFILRKVTELLADRTSNQTPQQATEELLPSVLELQILLLPYPRFNADGDAEEGCGAFVSKLDYLILSELSGNRGVLQWAKVVEATSKISELVQIVEDRLRLALHVGQPAKAEAISKLNPQLLSALNLVKLKTAMKLIQDGWAAVEQGVKGDERAKFTDLAQRAKTLVQDWQRSPDENVALEVMEWRRAKASLWSKLMNS